MPSDLIAELMQRLRAASLDLRAEYQDLIEDFLHFTSRRQATGVNRWRRRLVMARLPDYSSSP
jgi:hypothetical protein